MKHPLSENELFPTGLAIRLMACISVSENIVALPSIFESREIMNLTLS